MATPTLDLTLLNFLIPIFSFLLVFALCYALLTKTTLLGENKVVQLVVSLCLAAIASFAGRVSNILELAIPWVILLLVIGVIIFSLYGFFGVPQERTWGLLGKPTIVLLLTVIFVISLIIVYNDVLSPYSNVEQAQLENGTIVNTTTGDLQKDPTSESLKALVHPRIMGAMFILIIAALTAKMLTDKLRND